MAKGILNIQAADGAVIGLHVPDGLTSGERQIALGANLSNFASYHLLQGNLAVSASTITQGFNTTLYTGNGSTQSITTGIDMSTQWGNTAEEKFGGLVWQKYKSAVAGHRLFDTINGTNKYLDTSTTGSLLSVANTLTSFNSNGFSLGSTADTNSTGVVAVTWNFQTTHRVSGTTNHGKAYTCHFNPFTGFTMVQYTGSGIAGHYVPHHLDKVAFCSIKRLDSIGNWRAHHLYGRNIINSTGAMETEAFVDIFNDGFVNIYDPTVNGEWNSSGKSYIMYGWANSYFDKSNKLIGNYEIGVYQGTGVSGNKVKTRGKPAWVMTKRLDSIGNWAIYDNKRANDGHSIYANTSEAEYTASDLLNFTADGFVSTGNASDNNTSGGQYLYMVAYDTNSNGGGSFYEKTTDNAQLQAVNTIIPTAQGIDSNGAKNMIVSKNETITGISLTEGVNYVYWEND